MPQRPPNTNAPSREHATRRLIEALTANRFSRVRELSQLLGIDKSLLNSVLYKRADIFLPLGPQPPLWFLRANAASADDQEQTGSKIRLYEWQKEALDSWSEQGSRGIVEAVTGAGKTRVGIAAIKEQLSAGGRAAVLVPTVELLDQWHEELGAHLPDVSLARLGDGHRGSLERAQVLIATVNSARVRSLGLPETTGGLLVADECHRYGAVVNKLALKDEFETRLGLSATYERSDGAHTSVLLPYFGQVVFELGYPRAIRDKVVAPVRVALLGVDLTASERRNYTALSDDMRNYYGRLLGLGVPREPFGEFLAEVNRIADHGAPNESLIARGYLSVWGKRRELLAETDAKVGALARLVPAISQSDRSIVFTRTTQSADRLASCLVTEGIAAEAHHSGVDGDRRRDILQRFLAGNLKAVTAAMTLNEGIDVPEADLGIVIAASRQRREMIQRMGRVLRLKKDRRSARFVIVYIRDTGEDPACGAHEAFLDDILEVAEAQASFDAESDPREIAAFLSPNYPSDPR